MKIRRIIASALALLTVASVSGCAISAALEEEGGFKFNSTQVSAEQEIGEIKLHDMSATPEWFNGISAPAIFSDYTGTPYETVEGDLYVSPDGNDETGDGSKEKPYATFEKAKSAVREIKAAGKLPKGTFTVVFMPGEYRLTEGIVFSEEDAGTEDCRIIYAAYDAREVVFKGSKKLNASDFTAVGEDIKAILPDASKDKVLMVDLKKYGITADQLHIYSVGQINYAASYDPAYVGINVQFYFNRQAFDLARYPNGDYFINIDEVISDGDAGSKTPAVFQMYAADVNRVKSWHSLDDVWVVGRFHWDFSTMSSPVSFNLDERTVTCELTCFDNIFSSAPYRFFNVLDELDIPGEWYLDREDCILYMYPTGDMADAELEMVVDFDDNMISGDNADYITFMGLTFMGGRATGIDMGGDYLLLDRCKFYGFGGDDACDVWGTNITIRECESHYTGRGGIQLSGGDRTTLTPANNLMENCYVTHWGLNIHTFSVGLVINGFGNAMRHCEAAYSEGNAVSVMNGNTVVEYNVFHDCTTWATDCGTNYVGGSLLACPNNQIRYNLFYNLGTPDGKTAAIFLDAGHGNQRMYGNLFVNIMGNGITTGGGRNNTIMNNIFVNIGMDPIYASQAYFDEYHSGMPDRLIGSGYAWGNYMNTPKNQAWYEAIAYLEHVMTDINDPYTPHFLYNPTMSHITNNIVVDDYNNIGRIFEQTRQYSIVRDNYTGIFDSLATVFVDAQNGDYRIREDAPIFEVMDEFKDIPYHLIGRY